MKNFFLLIQAFFLTSVGYCQNSTNDTLIKNCEYITTFYPDNSKKAQGCLVNGKKEGFWYEYYQNQTFIYKSYYKNNSKNGISYIYYKSGKLRQIGKYKEDTPYDTTIIFKDNGDTIAKFFTKIIGYKKSVVTWRKYYDPSAKKDGVMEFINGKRYMWRLGEPIEL